MSRSSKPRVGGPRPPAVEEPIPYKLSPLALLRPDEEVTALQDWARELERLAQRGADHGVPFAGMIQSLEGMVARVRRGDL